MRFSHLQRCHVAALAVAVMVLFAGCSAFDSGEDSSVGTTTSAATTTTTTTGEPTTTDDETTERDSDGNESGDATADAEVAGTMTVLLGGSQIGLSGGDGPVTFRDGDRQWFASEQDVTVAAALAAQGIEVTDSSLTYEGTTYNGSNAGTSVEVRVNGHAVDPTEHTLEDGDSVWVYVDSGDLDVEPPGEYIEEAADHQHGTIEVRVDGETLNLTRDEYQHQHQHFHLEGGDGDTWHAHTWHATLGWALSTLDIEVAGDTATIDGTTYDASESNTTVQVTVNGETLESAHDYRLKDGDQVAIVVEHSN